jgi:hypothetical protein
MLYRSVGTRLPVFSNFVLTNITLNLLSSTVALHTVLYRVNNAVVTVEWEGGWALSPASPA